MKNQFLRFWTSLTLFWMVNNEIIQDSTHRGVKENLCRAKALGRNSFSRTVTRLRVVFISTFAAGSSLLVDLGLKCGTVGCEQL